MVVTYRFWKRPSDVSSSARLRTSSFGARSLRTASCARAWGREGLFRSPRSRSGAALRAARVAGFSGGNWGVCWDSRRCRAARGPYFATRNTPYRSAALTRGRHFLKLSALRPSDHACGATVGPSGLPVRGASHLVQKAALSSLIFLVGRSRGPVRSAPLRLRGLLSSPYRHSMITKYCCHYQFCCQPLLLPRSR